MSVPLATLVQIAQILGPTAVALGVKWLVDRRSERERRRSVGAHMRYAEWKS